MDAVGSFLQPQACAQFRPTTLTDFALKNWRVKNVNKAIRTSAYLSLFPWAAPSTFLLRTSSHGLSDHGPFSSTTVVTLCFANSASTSFSLSELSNRVEYNEIYGCNRETLKQIRYSLRQLD